MSIAPFTTPAQSTHYRPNEFDSYQENFESHSQRATAHSNGDQSRNRQSRLNHIVIPTSGSLCNTRKIRNVHEVCLKHRPQCVLRTPLFYKRMKNNSKLCPEQCRMDSQFLLPPPLPKYRNLLIAAIPYANSKPVTFDKLSAGSERSRRILQRLAPEWRGRLALVKNGITSKSALGTRSKLWQLCSPFLSFMRFVPSFVEVD